MKKKVFKIPIYGGNLIVIYGKKLKKFKKRHNLQSIKGYDGFFFKENNDYYIVLRCKKQSIIGHESLHFVGELLEGAGVVYSSDSDEPFCYWLSWTIRKVNKTLK